MGPPGVSCRDMLLAGAAAQRASVLIVGPLGACAICRRFCAWASSRSLPGWPAMCWGRAGGEGGLPATLSRGPAADPERDSWEGKAMVGNMIRVLRAPMTLLAVDEAGMSTVEIH